MLRTCAAFEGPILVKRATCIFWTSDGVGMMSGDALGLEGWLSEPSFFTWV